MRKRLRKVFMVTIPSAILSLCLLCGCSTNSDTEVINIYSANYEEQLVIQRAYLAEKFPEYEINITYMTSGDLAAKIMSEGRDTEADIVMSLSSSYANQIKNEDLLRQYTPSMPYKEEYSDPDGYISPNGVWCGAFLINTEELANNNLPEPKSYEDLLDPVYKGHIVMTNPSSSSTGYFFLLGILNLYGEEKGWEYFAQLKENILLYGDSGSIPAAMVEKGEAVIGLGIEYEGMRLEENGRPVKVVFPEEGAPYDYDTALLINRMDEPSEAVIEIMDAITSIEGNEIFNDYNISVLEDAKNRGNYPADFKLLDMSGITDSVIKIEYTDKWSNLIG